jgi:quinoprotein glucose dehydrogenase
MARPSSSPSPVLAHAAALAAALAAPLAAPLAAQHEQGAADPNAPMYVAPRSADAQEAIAGFQLAETLVCDLVASEPDLANPVAFAIDGKGRVYVAETFRIKDGRSASTSRQTDWARSSGDSTLAMAPRQRERR